MIIRTYNRDAWNQQAENGNRWTNPVSAEVIAAARRGESLEFGHTLEDQIGGQIESGFAITGFSRIIGYKHPCASFADDNRHAHGQSVDSPPSGADMHNRRSTNSGCVISFRLILHAGALHPQASSEVLENFEKTAAIIPMRDRVRLYTVMAMLDPHPALKAVSPQASTADMFLGGDFHHNGAFRLSYAFEYAVLMESSNINPSFDFDKYDTFEWYLKLGPLPNANAKIPARQTADVE